MIRIFYRFHNEGNYPARPATLRRHEIIMRLLHEKTPEKQEFYKNFFTIPYGHNAEFVRQYAARKNLPESAIWRDLNGLCRQLFIELGIIDQ